MMMWPDTCAGVAASAVSDGGRVVCGCRCFPGVGVCGGVSHHAARHVWPLSGGHGGLHPDPRQNPGGNWHCGSVVVCPQQNFSSYFRCLFSCEMCSRSHEVRGHLRITVFAVGHVTDPERTAGAAQRAGASAQRWVQHPARPMTGN